MGTRGSVGHIKNNVFKGGYKQFDCYLDGEGEEVVHFLRTHRDRLDELKEKVDEIKWVKREDEEPTWEEKEFYKKNANLKVGRQSLSDWYCLLREYQGIASYEALLNGEIEHFIDNSEFIKDSLFCECAYILNFDTDRIEFYIGFQKTPDPSNRFGTSKFNEVLDREYYPCKKVIDFPMNDIPEDWKEQVERAAGFKEESE